MDKKEIIPALIPSVTDDFNHLNMVNIPQQQVGIWCNGNCPGFLYQDYAGIVWRVEAGSFCHLRDAGRATGISGKHWNNSELPRDFNFDKAENPAFVKKSRWAGVVVAEGGPPVCNPGTNTTIMLPDNAVLLDGSGSYDRNGDVLHYHWSINKTEDPLGIRFDSPNACKTVVTFIKEGIYIFDLKVKNRHGLSDVKSITITVLPKTAPPKVRVGDPTLTLVPPFGNVILDGSNLVGQNKTYLWEQLSGPVMPVIANADKPVAYVNGLIEGAYDFQISVIEEGKTPDIGAVKIIVSNTAPQPVSQVTPVKQEEAVLADTPQEGTVPVTSAVGAVNQVQQRSVLQSDYYSMVPQDVPDEMPYTHSTFGKQDEDFKRVLRPKRDINVTGIILIAAICIGTAYLLFNNKKPPSGMSV